MKENVNLEFKETFSRSFLKTVSAFSNYGTGTILFGVNKNGEKVGVSDQEGLRLQIENSINDNITPHPDYTLKDRADGVVELTVYEGSEKPYFYNSKAYKRSDTASVPVDRTGLTRLILEGTNTNFEELEASSQDLTFDYLAGVLRDKLAIENTNLDILKTLNLYNDEVGYNKAGELVSDSNQMPGIDIARFGENINLILGRYQLAGKSILSQYDEALDLYEYSYQYEEIEGFERVKKERVPREAFREALANAIVHRAWDINAHIRVSFYPDRIEVSSPGGLPKGVSEEAYLSGDLSILRNPILGNLFFRLDYIEQFGTGVRRIKAEYKNSVVKPVFDIKDDVITLVLPEIEESAQLSGDYDTVYKIIASEGEVKSAKVQELTGFGSTKTLNLLNDLIDEGYVKRLGAGRNTRYTTSFDKK